MSPVASGSWSPAERGGSRSTPLTDLPIPPRVRLPEPEPGRIEGDVYRNGSLDVVGRVPPGMLGHVGGDVDFVVERPGTLVRGGMSVSTRITSDAEDEKTFGEVQACDFLDPK
jgi:hypothetical protein